MFPRANYKQVPLTELKLDEHSVGTYKYDGGCYFVPIDEAGNLRFISRRESVRGGYPDKTDRVPHLNTVKLPQFAGNVYTVELIHSGVSKALPESHTRVTGILNSLPAKAVATQASTGPVRAVLHDVVHPKFATYKEKLLHMKEVEKAVGSPETFFVAEPHIGPEAIYKLIRSTKLNGTEGVIVTHLNKPEESNPRFKIKHKVHHNLKVSKIIQEVDIHGEPKQSMGALEVTDASNKVVGYVGTGFTKEEREDAFRHPGTWLQKLIQVESMGIASNRLRSPVYNGDADGDWDTVQ